MGLGYSEVVERLQLYRRAQRKTQRQMSAELGVTQSHYAKLESGANVISYDCLKTFESNGGDLNYLITGKCSESGILDDYMIQCTTRKGKLQMQRLIVWAINVGLALEQGREESLPGTVYRNLRLAQMEMDMPWSVWKSIRKLDEITQFQMAEILGINIKRYVRLENEIIGPDAEILYRLYSGLSYTPCVVMSSLRHTSLDEVRLPKGRAVRCAPGYTSSEEVRQPQGHALGCTSGYASDEAHQPEEHVLRNVFGYSLTECNDAWNYFSEEIRNRLVPILAQGLELIRRGEERN